MICLFAKFTRCAKVYGLLFLMVLFGCWMAGQANSDHMNSRGAGRAMFCVFIPLKRVSHFRLHVTDKVQLKLSPIWRLHQFFLSFIAFPFFSLYIRTMFTYASGILAYAVTWIVLRQDSGDGLSPDSWKDFMVRWSKYSTLYMQRGLIVQELQLICLGM